MFNLLVDILTPGITHAGILNDGRKLLAKLGKDVMATPSAAIDALITNHVFRYQTDTIERLAADVMLGTIDAVRDLERILKVQK